MKFSQVRLLVDDFGGVVERLGDAAVAGPVDRIDWGGRVAYDRDPSGNLIELFESIPKADANS